MLVAAAAVGCLLAPRLCAQNDQTPVNSSDAASEQAQPNNLGLPDELAEGRPLSAIAVPDSQLVELVPRNYQAVTLQRLSAAVNDRIREAVRDKSSRLRSSFYDIRLVEDTLISERDRSAIVIETDREPQTRRSLGKVNLAISPQGNVLPRLESASTGELVAVLPDGAEQSGLTTIGFSWSLSGIPNGIYRDFKLQIPRTPETRIVLSTPVDVHVEAIDGVLRSRPSVPPGAEPRSSEVRWYEIEAGGLSTVEIRTYKPADLVAADTLVVRRSSIQYDIDSFGTRWWQRMTVHTRGGRPLPPMEISGGIVKSIEVDQVSTGFEVNQAGENAAVLNIKTTLGGSPASVRTTKITIAGDVPRDQITGWVDLPRATWSGSDVIQTQASDQVQVSLRDPLSLVSWELPGGWTQTASQRNLFRAGGPPIKLAPAEPQIGQPAWSRLRLSERSAVTSSNTMMRLTAAGKSATAGPRITANGLISVDVDPQRIMPLRLSIQPRWELSLTMASSRRLIDEPIERQDGWPTEIGKLTIWPEADDVVDGKLLIEVSGQRNIPQPTTGMILPATWLVRVDGVANKLTALVVPPTDLNWSGQTALQPDQIAAEELTLQEAEFFVSVPEEALIFRPVLGSTPSLSLQPPDVSFDVVTSLNMELDGSEIVETLTIQSRLASQRLRSEFRVTGSPESPAQYRWSLRDVDDQVPINLPGTVGKYDPDQGLYPINLGDRNLRGKTLVGRRAYNASSGPITVRLPTVLEASSQNAEVLLGSGLGLTNRSESVELVPLEQASADPSASGSPQQRTTRLRYDPGTQPNIEVLATDDDVSPSIVWQQDISVTSSSRGSDSIWALFRVSSSKPIEIDYDPDLRLELLSLNGENIDLAAVLQRPIRLPAAPGINTVRLLWNRNQLESGWIRRCKIPKIKVSGVNIKSSYRLTAAHDTFAPASFFQPTARTFPLGNSLTVTAGSQTTLIHRNLALAVGWLIAALVFASCWLIAQQSPLIVAALVALATTSMFIWWPWRLAIIGWVIVPSIAAALLEATSRYAGSPADHAMASAARDKRPGSSFEFSYTQRILIWVLIGLGLTVAAPKLRGQQPPSSKNPAPPINILVPIDQAGSQVGDKVYVPKSLYEELFSPRDREDGAQVTIQNAVYRVNLHSGSGAAPEVKAEYVVHVDGVTNEVRLPILSTNVRRVELRQGDQNRILRSVRDRDGILVNVPPGELFELSLTLIPTLTVSGTTNSLVVNIPPIASSRLFVEADREISNVRIAQSVGKINADGGLRRWNADLGPVGAVAIDYEANAAPDQTQPLIRRYWVSVGKTQTSIDCEIESPPRTFAGDDVQLEVLHPAMPAVVSPGWKLLRQSLVNPSRRLITLVKTADSADPIRLLWTMESVIGEPTAIPEVVAAGASGDAKVAFALQQDRDLQVTLLEDTLVEELETAEFLSRWRGDSQRGAIDRAFVASQGMPTLIVDRPLAPPPTLRQSHHLHVGETELDLRYSATLNDAGADVRRYTLQVPSNVDLKHVFVDGQPVDTTAVTSGARQEILLGELGGAEATLIEVIASAPTRRNRKFTPPAMISLWPSIPTQNTCLVTRSPTVNVALEHPDAAENEPPPIDVDTLALGQIPVASWQADLDAEQAISPMRLLITARQQRFDCLQLIGMSYDDGRWSMRTVIEFQTPQIPDFIDVLIPSRWSASLEIEPSTAWMRRPTTDPSVDVVRIAAGTQVTEQMMMISGKLDSTEQGGIAVPQVVILGKGLRTIHASVPRRATSQWKSRGVEEAALPESLATTISLEGERQNFLVQDRFSRSTWSVESLPLPDVKTISLAADAQVFLQQSNALILCRWDLLPGRLKSVMVRLPPEAECLGVWTAQRPVKFALLNNDSAAGADPSAVVPRLLRVPLSLSRLSQPVEVLLSIPLRRAQLDDYLPQLLALGDDRQDGPVATNVPSQQQWVAVYTPSESAPSTKQIAERLAPPANLNTSIRMDEARAMSLAAAVVDAIDQSLETLAERPRGEVATWLSPWVARYRKVAESAGRPFDPQTTLAAWPDAEDAEDRATTQPASETILASSSVDETWRQLDRRMATLISRFLPEDHATADPLFGVGRFDGYTLTSVSKVGPASPAQPIHSMSAGMQDLRDFLANGLTLLTVCGLLALMWPFRRYVRGLAAHPAFWLAMIGVFGLYVAPAPVAIAVIVIAITLPLFSKAGPAVSTAAEPR
jgi:hypothetical protein